MYSFSLKSKSRASIKKSLLRYSCGIPTSKLHTAKYIKKLIYFLIKGTKIYRLQRNTKRKMKEK